MSLIEIPLQLHGQKIHQIYLTEFDDTIDSRSLFASCSALTRFNISNNFPLDIIFTKLFYFLLI